MNIQVTASPVAAKLAAFAADARPSKAAAEICRQLVFDIVALAIAARETDYVQAALASAVDEGSCTAFGHRRKLGLYDAAVVNGTAAHGEDFDDTFEGGPIHAGAVIVSAVMAIAEKRGLGGDAVMRGIAIGTELMCRMSLVAPQATHKASFHPTAIFGAPAAAAAVGAAIGLLLLMCVHGVRRATRFPPSIGIIAATALLAGVLQWPLIPVALVMAPISVALVWRRS